MATVGPVCNMQTNQLYLTLINHDVYYYPVRVVKAQRSNAGINTRYLTLMNKKSSVIHGPQK